MINVKTIYEDETEDEFYCEDGAINSCDRDCRDCDIHHKWWKERQLPFG